MNIILEGPDGSGKTTLAKALSVKMGMRYVRCPGSTFVGEFLRPLLKSDKPVDPTVKTLLFAAADYERNDKVKKY